MLGGENPASPMEDIILSKANHILTHCPSHTFPDVTSTVVWWPFSSAPLEPLIYRDFGSTTACDNIVDNKVSYW